MFFPSYNAGATLGRALILLILKKGDFNLDLLKYETHPPTADYLDLISEYKFLPRIVRPTRIQKQSATLIDHILTQDSGIIDFSGIINTEIAGNCGFTDHFPTVVVLKANPPKTSSNETRTKTFFTPDDHKKRRDGLNSENWDDVYSETDPNRIYDLIQAKYE